MRDFGVVVFRVFVGFYVVNLFVSMCFICLIVFSRCWVVSIFGFFCVLVSYFKLVFSLLRLVVDVYF